MIFVLLDHIKNEFLYVIQQIFGSQRPAIKYSKLVEFSRIAFLSGFPFSLLAIQRRTLSPQQSGPNEFPYYWTGHKSDYN